MDKKLKLTQSIILGAIITVVLVPIITITAELAPPFKDFLKTAFSHHWIAKSLILSATFVIISSLTFLTPYKLKFKTENLLLFLSSVTACATLVLFAFFFWETFFK